MFKSMLGTVVLAACAASAAQATTWNFSYQGFLDQRTNTFLSDYTLSGSFTGTDADNNGFISLYELTQFKIADTELIDSPSCNDPPVGLRCSLDFFSFHPHDVLTFDARKSYSDEALGHFTRWVSGNRIEDNSYSIQGSREDVLYWTAATVFTPPIPEPSVAAMSAAGLLVLAGAHLRRRHGPGKDA